MRNIYTVLFFSLMGILTVHSQSKSQAIQKFERLTGANVSVNLQSGQPEFIKFPLNESLSLEGNTFAEKIESFFFNYPDVFQNAELEDDFIINPVKEDQLGLKSLKLEQIFHGIPVFDGQLRFHFNENDELTAINGNYISGIKLNPTAQITTAQANQKALDILNNQDVNHSGVSLLVQDSELMIFTKGLVENNIQGNYLAYKLEVRNNQDVREFLFIDAYTGELVEQYTGIAHALDRELYEENTSTLVWEEGNTFPGTLTQWQQNEVEASGHIYNMFNNAFGYDSFNGNGATMITINNNPNISCPNANWNGYSANYCDGTAADDVVAHEWGHAYTEYTSGLIYAYQAGAMNEAYSDIWGETVDLINSYEDDDEDVSLRTSCFSSERWIIAEDATALNGGNGIRDMWIPTCFGNPGKTSDTQFYCGEGDSGGVHLNSGVPNHTYALLVDGGSYNGQTITGLGLVKAAHIFWRAQSEYLTSTSDFYNLADALEAACTDLIGINLEGLSTTSTPFGLSGETITTADFTELQEVLIAVELRANPDCGFSPILAETTDPCDEATSNPIFYEDWESGMDGWIATEIPEDPETWESRNWELDANLPDGRPGQGVFGPDPINGNCWTSLQNGILRLESPMITIPDYGTGIFELMFVHNIATEANWDGGNIKYSLNGGEWILLPSTAFDQNSYNGQLNTQSGGNDNPLAGEDVFTGADEGSVSGSWGRSFVDLSSIGVTANSTIQFRWEMGTDGCNGRIGWYLDEISVYNCDYSLSTNNVTISNSLSVYPNPSNGQFTISNPDHLKLVQADVFDINGRLIKSMKLDNSQDMQVDLSHVSGGIYFMNVKLEQSNETIKLIVR